MAPTMRRFGRRGFLIAGLLAAGLPWTPVARAQDDFAGSGRHWVATWQGSPQTADALFAGFIPPPPAYADQTLREVVFTSIGGPQIRLRLTNTFGAQPLAVGAVHVARAAEGSAIVPATDRAVTFGGQGGITIPPGGLALSDPVDLALPALSNLAVSIYVPQDIGPATQHTLGRQTSYVAGGDATGAVVTLGDSITDGFASTVDANLRWPDQLARRLVRQYGNRVGVSNAGISGNRVLNDGIGPNALARLDRDVLSQAGVRHVTLMEGINDIGFSVAAAPGQEVGADRIIAGHRQVVARARELGLKVYGCTLTPFQGAGYYTAAGEAKRQEVNAFIRGSGEFDAVIDFDRAVRDPQNPLVLAADYDSGDHLHPNDAGYAAMATAIDLSLFDPAASVLRQAAE